MTTLSTSNVTRSARRVLPSLRNRIRQVCLFLLAGVGLSSAARGQVTVVSRQPARHAVAVPRGAAVAVGFSQVIAAGTAANLRVYGNLLRGRRPGSVVGGGTSTLTFTPTQGFAPGEMLSVSLPPTLTSAVGTAVARQVYQFTAATGGPGRGFFVDTTLVGNTTSRDQVLGDLDNDGDLDLVTTGALYGCRIFLNNGAGRFTFKTGVVTAQTPSGIALADVDQDGYLDMLVSDADNATVAVCINDGTGDFIGSVTGAQNASVGPRPVGVAAGDVDGDGDLDFVTANADGNSATVRLNNGSLPLLYGTAYTVAMGSGPTAVALADIDNDGDLDLLTTNQGTASNPTGSVSVSRNSGLGSFGAYSSVAVGLQPTELVLADVDGDGDLDLLTANAADATLSLRLNNGSGTFGGTTTVALPAGSTPSGLRAGDLDADGDLDVLVAQGTGGRVITLLNTAGTFAVQARALRLNRGGAAAPVQAVGVVLGDVDGDLDLDLITSDEHGHVLLSRNLDAAPALPVPVISSLAPAVGPVGSTVIIAGTGLIDVTGVFFNGVPAPGFVPNGAGTALEVLVPAGASSGVVTVATEEAGTATSPGPFTIVVPVPVLVTGMSPSRNATNVARNSNVAATFAAPVTAATAGNLRVFGNQRRGRRPGVLTGGGTAALGFDPDQDFAAGEQISVSLPASLRAADGNPVSKQVVQFTAATGGPGQLDFTNPTALAISQPGEPVLGDIDNDSDLDLLVPNLYGGTVRVRLNDGTGTFSAAPDLTTGLPGVQNLLLADVDADGDLDLLVVSDRQVGVMRNNGSGTFGSATTTTLGQAIRQAVVGDVDADGDLDLVMTTTQEIAVRLNNGAGVFAGSYGLSLVSGPRYLDANNLALGDVDADGDLDLLVTCVNSYYSLYLARVELNNGAGQFSDGPEVVLPGPPTRVSLGDLDGDGDLDAAVQNTFSGIPRVSVRLNNGSGTFSGLGDMPLGGAGMLLGDADGDGDLDIIMHSRIALNNGTGVFATILANNSTSNYPAGLAVGDVDGDFDLDLITAQENNVVSVRFNRPLPAPTIGTLAPSSGPVGSPVLLTGTNLIGTRTLTLNGLAVPGFVVNSPTELLFTVPAGATTGPLAVTTPAGTATSATPFVVTVPLTVLALNPARHATSTPVGTAVAVTFAQPIGSASAGNVRVFGSRRRGLRPGTVTGGGTSTLTFTPTQAFASGEAVSVSLPASLAGAAGGNVRPQVYQFTAAAGGTGTGLFPTTTEVPIYYRSIGLAVGDIDNDGDQDLLTTDGSIRLNNGNGTFSAPAGVTVGADPFGLTLADLNGDGSLDLLSTLGAVRINTGNGTFTDLPNFASPNADPRDLAVGDLDGDGDLDVAIPRYGTDSLYVSYNDGTGRFPTRQQVAVGFRPVGIAIGDVDNDGDLDLIAANEGYPSSTLSVCFNNGIGLFTRSTQLPAGSYVGRVVLGDLDGDGDLDLVTSTGMVRFNDGAGNFSGTQTTAAGRALALGDLDADGDLDLVVSSGTASAVRLNNGQGQFSGSGSIGFVNTWDNLVLADLDGDGDLDAATTHTANRIIQLSLNERVAPPVISSFSPASGLPGATININGNDFIGATTVTFNGTAAPGFIINSAQQLTVKVPAGATTGPVSISNSRGTGTSAIPFTVLLPVAVVSVSPARNAVAPTTAAIAATFGQALATNTEANLTVFSARRGGRLTGTRTGAGSSTLTLAPAQAFQPDEQLSVTLPAYTEAGVWRVVKQVYQFRAAVGGPGRGFFSSVTGFPATGSTNLLVAGDVDNDGDQDLLTAYAASVAVQRNNGAGAFAPAGSVAVAPSVGSVVLGDIDGDGDLDLATASWSTNAVSIRRNDGTGNFSGTVEVTVGDSPRGVALADMDGDGDLDLITFNSGSAAATTSVRFNDGTGSFSGTTDEFINNITNTSLSNTEIADVDGDGDLDLVVVLGASLHVRLNNGLGVLTAATTTPPSLPYGALGLYLRDIDADGDLDILSIGVSGINVIPSKVSVGRNDGAGNFTLSDFEVPSHTGGLAVGDVDADGDVDLLVTGDSPDAGQLWLNNGQGLFAQLLELPMGTYAGLPLLADLDGDGDLDLVTSSAGLVAGFSYGVRLNGPPPPPVITSFSPAAGPVGTTVVITGSGFLGTTAVRFNGTAAPGFVVNSPTQLTATVPAGAGTGSISVVSPVATAVSGVAFTVQPLVSATSLLPGRNAVAAARNAPVTLTLATPVTAATAGNLRVFGSQLRGRRPGVLAGGGTAALSFDPDQDFAPGEQISVSLPGTLQTTNGGVVRRQVYQFTAATGGPGRGAFRAGTDVVVGRFAAALAVGDLDNDGDLDMLTSNETGYPTSIDVQLNDGPARFHAGTRFSSGVALGINQLALADVDADGDLDVLANDAGYGMNVCLNNGNATFAPATSFAITCNRFALGDLDADGDLDLVAVAYQAGTLSVALNDGQGVFTAQSAVLATPTAFAVVLGDVDGDGDLDVLTSNDTNGVRLFLNDGAGSLAPGPPVSVPGAVLGLALGDADNDGDLDLAVGYNDSNGDSWLVTLANNGSGSLTGNGPRVAAGRRINQVLFGDVDHDADLDLVAINGNTDDVSVRLNDGAGHFAATLNIPVHNNPAYMALGDLDGDGDLDIAVVQAGSGTNYIDIRLNDGLALATTPASFAAAGLAVYPNPAHAHFTVSVPPGLRQLAAQAPLRLYNALGQLVLEQASRVSAAGELTVDVQRLPAGVYTLRLLLGNELRACRVVVY